MVKIINIKLPIHVPIIKYNNTFGKEMVVNLIFFIKNIYLFLYIKVPFNMFNVVKRA